MTKEVVVLAGFFAGPIFYEEPNGTWLNHSPQRAGRDLGLSDELVAELIAWDEEYQAIFDESYPPDSQFPSPEAEHAWVEKGKQLSQRIKKESRTTESVDYQADGQIQDGTCVFR